MLTAWYLLSIEKQDRGGFRETYSTLRFLIPYLFRTQLWRSRRIIVTSGVGSGTFREMDDFHNATEMGDLREGFFEDSSWVVRWIAGIPEFNFHGGLSLSRDRSSWPVASLTFAVSRSGRSFVNETQEPGTKSRARRSREIGEPCRRHVSQTNIPWSRLRFFMFIKL